MAVCAPSASVIIAACNAGRFIRATVDSLLQQTLPSFEPIMAGDGSTEDTLERVHERRWR
jgi:glycosyltransferase involved in cell wall biosynthesis